MLWRKPDTTEVPDDLIVEYARPLASRESWTWTILDRAKSSRRSIVIVASGTAGNLIEAKDLAREAIDHWAVTHQMLAVVRDAHIVRMVSR